MDDTVESLKAALAVEKAAREKAEAERDEARECAREHVEEVEARLRGQRNEARTALAAAQKRIEALEGAVAAFLAAADKAANVNPGWAALSALRAPLASPSESAPQPTPETRVDVEVLLRDALELFDAIVANTESIETEPLTHRQGVWVTTIQCHAKVGAAEIRGVAPSLIAELRARRAAPTGQQQEAGAAAIAFVRTFARALLGDEDGGVRDWMRESGDGTLLEEWHTVLASLPLPESALLTKAAPLTQPAVPEKEVMPPAAEAPQGSAHAGAPTDARRPSASSDAATPRVTLKEGVAPALGRCYGHLGPPSNTNEPHPENGSCFDWRADPCPEKQSQPAAPAPVETRLTEEEK